MQLVTGPTNASKAGVVLGLVRRWAAAGRRPVLVVPTGPDAIRYRRELVKAGGGVSYDVDVVTFGGLVSLVRRALELPAATLGPEALDRVLATALAAVDPGRPLGGTAGKRGVRRRLAALLEELAERGFGPDELVDDLGALDPAEHGVDPRLVEDLKTVLSGAAQAGERIRGARGQSLPTAATLGRRVRTALANRPAAWDGRPVAWYGFDDLTFPQQAMVRALARAADVVVSLPFEDGRIATAARRPVLDGLRADARDVAGAALGGTGLLPLRPGADVLEGTQVLRIDPYELVLAPGATDGGRGRIQRRLFESDDPADATVLAARPPDGARPSDDGPTEICDDVVLVLGGDARAETEALADELSAAVGELGIGWSDVAIAVRDAEGPTGARIERELAERGIPVARPREVPARRTAIGRALVAVGRLAIGSGSADDVVTVLRAGSPIAQRDLVDRLAITLRRDGIADAPTAIRRVDRSPTRIVGAALLSIEPPRSASELLTVLESATEALERTLDAVPGLPPARDPEHRALRRITAFLEQLRRIASAGDDLLPPPAELVTDLADLPVPTGEAPGPGTGRVEIAEPPKLRGRHVRVLALADLREQAFPAPEPIDPLIDRDARTALTEAGHVSLGLPVERVSAERLLFAELLGRPTQRLILSRPTSSATGEPLPEAPFLAAVDQALAPLRPRTVVRGVSAVRPPSRRAVAAAAPFGAVLDAAGRETVRRVLLERSRFAVGEVERLARCPVCWLVEHLGRAQDDRALTEPQIHGQLVHDVLDAALDAAAPVGVPYGDLDPAVLVAAGREALAERGPAAVRGLPDHRRAVLLRRVEIGVSAVLAALPERYGRAARRASEVAVGPDGEIPPLDLGDGATAVGRIDRLDRVELADGRVGVGVVDYKLGVGSAVGHGTWERTATLQAALYLYAVTAGDGDSRSSRSLELPAYALYQPTSPASAVPGFAAPPARPPAGLELRGALGATRSGVRDADAVAEIVAAARERAVAAVAAVRAGHVTPDPERSVHGATGECDHPAIARLLS